MFRKHHRLDQLALVKWVRVVVRLFENRDRLRTQNSGVSFGAIYGVQTGTEQSRGSSSFGPG